MIGFLFPEFDYMAPALREAGFGFGDFTRARFPNEELVLNIGSQVAGSDCFVVGSVGPPDSNILDLTLLAYTLKSVGADSVVAVLPYLGYARQDRAHPTRAAGIGWVGKLLASAGVHSVVSIEIHSDKAVSLFPVPIISLSPAEMLARCTADLVDAETTVVAPDEGAIIRAKEYAVAAEIKHVVHFEKERIDGVVHRRLVGEVTKKAVIVDDILDTGSTLVSAAQQLVARGVEDIQCVVAHALFTGDGWRGLSALNVRGITCLDTVPAARETHDPDIRVIPCAPLIAAHLVDGEFR
jgi:ribose-phosphate pyrophosphokinase